MSTWSCRLPGAESMGALPICLLAGLLQAPPSFSPRGAADRRAAYGGAPRGGHRAQGHAMLLCFARGYSCTGAMRRRRFPPACVQRRLGAVRARRALIAVTAHLLTGWIPWGAKTGQDCILLSPRSALSRAALCLLSSPRSLPSLRLSSTPTPLHRPTSIHPSSAPPLPLTLHGNLSARRPLRARAAGGIGERQGRMGVVSCQHVCDRERMKLHGRRCTSSAVVLQLQWGKQYALEASARAYIDCVRRPPTATRSTGARSPCETGWRCRMRGRAGPLPVGRTSLAGRAGTVVPPPREKDDAAQNKRTKRCKRRSRSLPGMREDGAQPSSCREPFHRGSARAGTSGAEWSFVGGALRVNRETG
ncbi:hypothetical protein B0H13DRAFT_356271 [Mycena leptocephala]|nr:hypothetical protein B0H13DRAFT_356271 [Mycena leptocephala]